MRSFLPVIHSNRFTGRHENINAMKTDSHVWPECIQTCMELIQGRNAKFLRTDSQAGILISAIQTDDHVWPEFMRKFLPLWTRKKKYPPRALGKGHSPSAGLALFRAPAEGIFFCSI